MDEAAPIISSSQTKSSDDKETACTIADLCSLMTVYNLCVCMLLFVHMYNLIEIEGCTARSGFV